MTPALTARTGPTATGGNGSDMTRSRRRLLCAELRLFVGSEQPPSPLGGQLRRHADWVLTLVQDLDDLVRRRIDQHWLAVDHRVAISRRPVFRRYVVIVDPCVRKDVSDRDVRMIQPLV